MKFVVPELIIGYGNELCGDDAVGIEAARALFARGYNAITVHQLVPELAERIAAARRVIFIDCDLTLPPGEVALRKPSGSHLHGCTPEVLMSLARTVYDSEPKCFFIGIGPSCLDLGAPLSEPVLASLARFLDGFPEVVESLK